VPINVRCYPNSDIIVRRSEVTLRARTRLMHCNMIVKAQTESPPRGGLSEVRSGVLSGSSNGSVVAGNITTTWDSRHPVLSFRPW
jgi:hypothetical protein